MYEKNWAERPEIASVFIEFKDRTYYISAREIANSRALFYSGRERELHPNASLEIQDHAANITYQAEYDYSIRDEDELLDWMNNYMDWKTIASMGTFTMKTPEEPDLAAEFFLGDVKINFKS